MFILKLSEFLDFEMGLDGDSDGMVSYEEFSQNLERARKLLRNPNLATHEITYENYLEWRDAFVKANQSQLEIEPNLTASVNNPDGVLSSNAYPETATFCDDNGCFARNATTTPLSFGNQSILLRREDGTRPAGLSYLSQGEVAEIIQEVPWYLKPLIEAVHIERFRDDVAAMRAGIPGVIYIYPTFRGSEYTENFKVHAILHEIGHVWSLRKWGESANSPKWLEWQNVINRDTGHVSDYGKTNVLEDFADGFSEYLLSASDPEAREDFRQRMPAHFKEYEAILAEIHQTSLTAPYYWDKMGDLFTQLSTARANHNPQTVIEIADKILALDPESYVAIEAKAESYNSIALQAIQGGNPQDILPCLQMLYDLDPKNISFQEMAGTTLSYYDQEAVSEAETILNLDSQDLEPQIAMASLLIQQDKLEEAQTLLNETLESTEPTSPPSESWISAQMLLASIYENQLQLSFTRIAKAPSYEEKEACQQDTHKILIQLKEKYEYILLSLEGVQYSEGLVLMQAKFRADEQLNMVLTQLSYLTQPSREGFLYADELMSLQPQSDQAVLQAASAHLAAGNIDTAEKAVWSVLNKAINNAGAVLVLAQCNLARGDYTKAIGDLEFAISILKKNGSYESAENWIFDYYLLLAHYKSGQLEQMTETEASLPISHRDIPEIRALLLQAQLESHQITPAKAWQQIESLLADTNLSLELRGFLEGMRVNCLLQEKDLATATYLAQHQSIDPFEQENSMLNIHLTNGDYAELLQSVDTIIAQPVFQTFSPDDQATYFAFRVIALIKIEKGLELTLELAEAIEILEEKILYSSDNDNMWVNCALALAAYEIEDFETFMKRGQKAYSGFSYLDLPIKKDLFEKSQFLGNDFLP